MSNLCFLLFEFRLKNSKSLIQHLLYFKLFVLNDFFKLFLIFLFLSSESYTISHRSNPHLILETLASVKRHQERVETSSLVFPSHCLTHFPVANNPELKTSTWTTIVEKLANKNSLWAENFIYFQLPYLRSPIVEQSELLLLRMYVTRL